MNLAVGIAVGDVVRFIRTALVLNEDFRVMEFNHENAKGNNVRIRPLTSPVTGEEVFFDGGVPSWDLVKVAAAQ